MEDTIRKSTISKYIENYDFSDENWSVKEIKENLKPLLGEVPAIKMSYEKDVMVNEVSGKAKEVKKLKSISVIYTGLDDEIKKTEFLLD